MGNLDPMSDADRISFLRSEIERHNRLYYQFESPEISDSEFDGVFRELLELETKHPELRTSDSPTLRIGVPPQEGFDTHTHRVRMLSLDNAFNDEELQAFDERVRKLGEHDGEVDYIVEPKFDGLSMSLTYADGLLTIATTRGDGETGEVVTANARTVRGVPLRLHGDWPGVVEVRGEVLMLKSVFEELNEKRVLRGEQAFANPRNAASGGMRQLDSRLTAARKLNFFAYSIGYVDGNKFDHVTQSEILQTLKQAGFPVSDLVRQRTGIRAVIDWIGEIRVRRPNLEFGIDGAVVKVENPSLRDVLGSTARGPRWAIACKYPSEEAMTELLSVTWQVGRTGTVTPVAELVPVFVGGTTVSRATLHNIGELHRKDVRPGDTVIVRRAGDVIPEVVGPVLEKRPSRSTPVVPPEECPVCNSVLIRTEGLVALKCPNKGCPAQIQSMLIHFASRRALDIDGLGEKQIARLVELGWLADIPGIYRLTSKRDALQALERMGEQSVANLIDSIEASKKRSTARAVFGLGLPQVGERTASDLTRVFGSIDSIARASLADLEAIPNIGTATAELIYDWFQNQANREMLRELKELGFDPRGEEFTMSKVWENQMFVFTGRLEAFKREEAEARVMRLGGQAASSISKKVTYVVAGPNAGAKLDRATKLGLTVIDEAEFLRMVKAAESSL